MTFPKRRSARHQGREHEESELFEGMVLRLHPPVLEYLLLSTTQLRSAMRASPCGSAMRSGRCRSCLASLGLSLRSPAELPESAAWG